MLHGLLVATEKHVAGDAFGGDFSGGILDHRDAARKRGLGEAEAVDHLVTRGLMRIDAAAQHLVSVGNGDVHVRREAVGGVTADGEPARGIQQEGVIGMDGGELDAVDRRIFRAAEAPFIDELGDGRLAFRQRRIERQLFGEVLRVAGVLDGGAFAIDNFRHVQRVVQFEGGRAGIVVERHEAHFGGGDEGLRGGLDFGVDSVVVHANAGAAFRLRECGGGYQRQRQRCEGDRPEGGGTATKHERIVLPRDLE